MAAIQYHAEIPTVLIVRTRVGEIKTRFVPANARMGIPPDIIVLAEYPASEYHEVF